MAEFDGLAEIGEAFAAAALDPSRWNAAMEAAARATGSFGAVLVPVTGARLPLFPLSQSMIACAETYVQDGWINRDVRYNSVPKFMRARVVSEFDFTTPDEMARHPYYEEFLRLYKLRWFGGVKVGSGADVWCLSIQRSITEGPFSQKELRRLARLSRRLSNAAELARAFGFARADAALQAFETSGSAAAMIDRSGEVIKLNASAERLLGPGLKIVSRRIVSSDREATAALDRALHELIWARRAEALHPPIVLPGHGRGRPILAYPSRVPGSSLEAFGQCKGFVVFVDLEKRLAAAPGDLAQAFGLTPTEGRLAARLLNEDSLETAADQLGVRYQTARNFLKSIFQKTETHRQGQLISLLARMAQRGPEPSAIDR